MTRIDIDGMTCAVCVSHVEKAILSVEGVVSAAVNLPLGTAEFNGDVSTDEVINSVIKSGYIASRPVDFVEKITKMQNEVSNALKTSIPALVISLAIMAYVMTGGNERFHLIGLAVTLSLGGYKVMLKGLKSLKSGANMYTLVFLAFLASLIWSVKNTDDAMWEATTL